MPDSGRRRTLRTLLVALVLAGIGGFTLAGCTGAPADEAGPAIRAYARAWSGGDPKALGELTDAPREASRAVAGYRQALGSWETSVRPVGEPSCALGGCEQSLRVVQQIPGVGPWRYSTTARLVAQDGRWRVRWAPGVYHPKLADGGELRVRPGQPATRTSATLLTVRGEPLAETAQVPQIVRRLAHRGGAVEWVGPDGESETLYRPDASGDRIRLTLSPEVQRAAESALIDIGGAGALVAIRASTGEVLAAVGDGALNGRYEPGSVFSVISAAALIDRGLDTAEEVSCPAQATAGETAFRNPGGQSRASGPFWEAFAWSCDTTVVGRSGSLRPGDLEAAAKRFGIGTSWDLGTPSYSGRLPAANTSDEDRERARIAATAIGRDGVTVSPLAMAGAAGAVSSGRPIRPSMVLEGTSADRASERTDASSPGAAGQALGEGVLTRVRGLLRAGVTDGPAAELEDPDHELHAKMGRTFDQEHEWIIGYRGDLAFAVMVPRDAVGVAKRFLEQYQ